MGDLWLNAKSGRAARALAGGANAFYFGCRNGREIDIVEAGVGVVMPRGGFEKLAY